MSYLVYLNNYNIRQFRAQYLWLLYEILSHDLDAHFILTEEYLRDYNKKNSWEVVQAEQKYGSFEKLISKLKPENYTVMKKPEELLDTKIPSKLLFETYFYAIPTQVKTIEKVLKEKDVKAGITWVNNRGFKGVLENYGIPTFHHELGPLRPPTYISTAYLDFSGVNGNTEFDRRFEEFLKIANEVPILSRKELLRVVSPSNYKRLCKILDNEERKYEIGVGLQVEVDTNLLLFNDGCNWIDPLLAAKADSTKKILVRPHPSAGYIMKKDMRTEIDDLKEDAVEFINKCDKIYCLNSSVGFEAMLLGREAKIFGDSPFRSMCNMDEATKLKALNFAVFGYLIQRELLFEDSYYSFRLANTGDEKAIYLDSMKRLLKQAKN